jgi:uncharacterized protein (TIGR03435 family)
MISVHLFDSPAASAILTHLLQSTAFVLFAWLLTLGLRNNPARVRFWVWMAGSIKFLVPFALLTSLGSRFATPRLQPAHTVMYSVIEQFNIPFAKEGRIPDGIPSNSLHGGSWIAPAIALVWGLGCLVMLLRWITLWLSARRLVMSAAPANEGPELLELRRAEARAQLRRSIPIALASAGVEPGVFGVFFPVLLWPSGLSQQLEQDQIRAIVAHEIEHVRHRDNLFSTLHAVVEILFWFHPAVHWMRSKLDEERERACDESVLQQTARPRDYAEGILKVCAYCLESPSPCVAGVSGSDLKERVLRIMKQHPAVTLTVGRRMLLLAAGLLAVAMPIGYGVVRGQSAGANVDAGAAAPHDLPKYEVVSIKPAASDDGRSLLRITPDGTSMQGVEVRMLLRTAFRLEPDRIIGAPSWVSSNRYDIEAKVAPDDAPKLDKVKAEDRSAMLLPLLVERFNLKYHHETRELPLYTLMVAKGGPKLTESKGDVAPPPKDFAGAPPRGVDSRGRMMMMPGRIESQDTTLDMLAHSLSPQLGHTVLDKTGLTGRYDYTLQWTPDDAMMPMGGGPGGGPGGAPGHEANTAEPGGPSLFTAIEEQLGLKLESTKGPVDVIVIDHLDLPSAN